MVFDISSVGPLRGFAVPCTGRQIVVDVERVMAQSHAPGSDDSVIRKCNPAAFPRSIFVGRDTAL
jgi:hypothetical protein